MGDLLPAHVASADRPNQSLAALHPQRKNDQHAAPFFRPADRPKLLFAIRVPGLGENSERGVKKTFDYGDRDPVLLAFPSVPAVPIKADNRWGRTPSVCIFVQLNVKSRAASGQGPRKYTSHIERPALLLGRGAVRDCQHVDARRRRLQRPRLSGDLKSVGSSDGCTRQHNDRDNLLIYYKSLTDSLQIH